MATTAPTSSLPKAGEIPASGAGVEGESPVLEESVDGDVTVAVSRETELSELDAAAADLRTQLKIEPSAQQDGEKRSPRIVAVANQKGGVAKTTTVVNLAVGLDLAGFRVLVVDMDPQGNASTALGMEHEVGTPSIYEVLVDGKSVADVAEKVPDRSELSVACATVDLAGAELELVSEFGRETRLKSALAETDEFDFILIDCPPSLGLLTINALTSAQEILIPLQAEYYALEGLGQLLGSVQLVQQHLNTELTIEGILITMFDSRTRLAPDVEQEAREHFGKQVYETRIPRSVRVSEAPSHGETVLTFAPTSPGAQAYSAFVGEFIARHGSYPQEVHSD